MQLFKNDDLKMWSTIFLTFSWQQEKLNEF